MYVSQEEGLPWIFPTKDPSPAMEIIKGGHPQLAYALAQYEMMMNQVTYIFLFLNVFSA